MLRRASALWRSVVPWHLATAWALTASSAVFALTWVAHGFDSGVRGGLVAFLAWATVRELAPKRAAASLLAPLVAVAFAIPGAADVRAGVATLLVARISARTVGYPPTLLDCLLLVPLAGWVAMRPTGLPVALVLAAIVFADGPPARRRTRVCGILMLAAALAVGAVEGTLSIRPAWGEPQAATIGLLVLLGACSVALVAVRLPRLLRTRDDRGRAHLHGARVHVARVALVACLAAAAAWGGVAGVLALAPAAAATCAAAIGGARLRPLRAGRGSGAVA